MSALGAISSTLARASSGVLYSEPGDIGADMKRYFTVRMRVPLSSPRFWAFLYSRTSSGSHAMLVVVVIP